MRRSLLIAFLMAACAPAALAASSPNGPILKDGVEITILPTLGAANTPGGLIQVGLDLEARSDDAARRLGFRSLRAETSVDCRAGANRFINAQAYAQPNLKGQATPRVVSGAWVHPNDDSYMSQVTARICASAGPAPTLAPSATSAKFTAPAPMPVVTSESLPPPAPTKPPPAPVRLNVSLGVYTPGPPPVLVAGQAAPAVSAPPAAHAFAPKPAPAAEAAVRPAGHAAVAQVAASPDIKDAQRVLASLHGMITPPLTGSVDPAVVQNAHIFRASVSGFSSMADAEAFCAHAAHISKTCWVHK